MTSAQDDLAWAIDQGLPGAGSNGTGEGTVDIQVNERFMREVTAASLDALEKANQQNPVLFIRAGKLTQLTKNDGGLHADILNADALRGTLDRVANYVRVDEKGSHPARPPKDVVADILALQILPFPILNGFAEAPVYLPGGELLRGDGFHHQSGLYLFTGDLGGVRSDMPMEEALPLLFSELLCDFPFADAGSKAHALALLLQPFVRPLILGATPLYLLDAPTRGTGKGLLAELVGLIAQGRAVEVMAMPPGEEEVEKRITSFLLAGYPMALLDNVTQLRSASLSAVLTATTWRGRRLGKSEMVDAPNAVTWMATGNNVTLSDEMVRRVVPIRIDAGIERPEDRTGFRHDRLPQWALENRALLMSACLSIIQAWVDAGMPKGHQTLGRFEAWVGIMGGILDVAGIPGFLTNRERLHAVADSESQEWTAFCEVWWESLQEAPVTGGALFNLAKENTLLADIWVGKTEIGAKQRLGRALAKKVDRVYGDYQIRSAGRDSRTNNAAYRLEQKSSPDQNNGNNGNNPEQVQNRLENDRCFDDAEPRNNGNNPPNNPPDPDTKSVESVVSVVSNLTQIQDGNKHFDETPSRVLAADKTTETTETPPDLIDGIDRRAGGGDRGGGGDRHGDDKWDYPDVDVDNHGVEVIDHDADNHDHDVLELD